MCSFAKFLALGLIASEGHGPVFAEAKDATEYQQIVGGAPTSTPADAAAWKVAICQDGLIPAYALLRGGTLVCADSSYDNAKATMLTEWKNEAKRLSVTLTGNPTIAGNTNNVKLMLIKELKANNGPYHRLTGQTWTGKDDKIHWKTLKVLRDAIDAAAKKKAEEEAAAKKKAEEEAKKKAEEEAAAKKKAEEKAQNETVGGVFGVLAGLAIAFVALLFSPCFQYDFKNHAFDWEKNYERPAYYEELDGSAHDWRNETNQFLGLPKEPSVSAGKVDSSKASSSALTVVPVVFVAGGAFAIARGLKKRRAQKKAKRASRAQVQVYEDL